MRGETYVLPALKIEKNFRRVSDYLVVIRRR